MLPSTSLGERPTRPLRGTAPLLRSLATPPKIPAKLLLYAPLRANDSRYHPRVSTIVYIVRALGTFPLIEIHEGHFVTRPTRMTLVNPPANGPRTVEVWKTEEKGSDVNIATYLLFDAFQKRCDTAVIISNDTTFLPMPNCHRPSRPVRASYANPVLGRKTQGLAEASPAPSHRSD